MRTFIDAECLTTSGDGSVLAAALHLVGEAVQDRVQLLAQLRNGAGVVVLTGPEGAPFWSLVSPEVKVRIVPDGDEYRERVDTPQVWAYRAVGFDAAESRRLAERKTGLPANDWRYDQWVRAAGLLADLEACGGRAPIIEEEFPARQWGIDDWERLNGTDDIIALDGEWDIDTASPTGASLADASEAGYVPLWASDLHSGGNDPRHPDLSSGGDTVRLKQALSGRLISGQPTVMHGARADVGTLYLGDPLELVGKADLDDTMVMAYLCGEPVLALKELTHKLLGRDPTEFPGNLSDLPAALGTRYAAADARNTYDLYATLGRTLAERHQWPVYLDIEKPLIPVIVSMEREGVPLDIDEVKRQYRDAVKIEMGMRYAIRDNYGFDVSQDKGRTLATNQVRQFVQSFRGTDPGSTDQRVLTLFPEGEIDLLFLYRRSRTLRRNFLGRALRYSYASTHPGHERHLFKARKRFTEKGELTDLGKYLDWKRKWDNLPEPTDSLPKQFRYFPRFNQAGSVDGDNHSAPRSGRLSSSDPNFTNQPRGDLRRTYVPPRGCKWWSWDYSSLELHIAAAISGDPEMLRILTEQCPDGPLDQCKHKPKHGDMHGYLQYKLYEYTKRLTPRPTVKVFNFMEIYGGGASKGVEIVAKDRVYITLETAKDIDTAHHTAFSGFWTWREALLETNAARGYAETLDGRRRYIPEYRSRDSERRAYADRAGANHSVQGTAADIVKRMMAKVVPVLLKYGAHMCSQVHDEINGWIPKDANLQNFKQEMEAILTSVVLPHGLRLKVEGGFGDSWGEAH